MELNELDFTGVSIKNIPEDTKEWLKQWRLNVLADEGKIGLWLFGPRGGGTSYAAQAIVGRMAFGEAEFLGDSAYVEAVDLVALVRATWDASSVQRAHSDDLAVFMESRVIEDRLNYLFYECRLLWIDDLHHDDINWDLWRKHIQPFIERRVKHRQPTVVSTTLPPADPTLPGKVIDAHFITVLCDAER
jgi:hypothetical protein